MTAWNRLLAADRAWFAANYATRVAKAWRNPPDVIDAVEQREADALATLDAAAARYRTPERIAA